MKIIFNSSPLIFLARLDFLTTFIDSADEFYLPEFVYAEIKAKQDEASECVQRLIDDNRIEVKTINLISLANSLNVRFGKGESEAIALATELQADYVILDDFAARKEAMRLGLNVRGTLAIIRNLHAEERIVRACCTKPKPLAINSLSGIESCSAPRKFGKICQNPCTPAQVDVPKS